jgi:2,5-diamino-6-(ribosylamino)-4(3H)-pyrimidinone 5'-phosphate reductase
VVDGRGRVREWEALRDVGHWSGVLALHAAATPPRPGRRVPELVVGSERVDLAGALVALGREHDARVVRVDSGGALIGALLAAGLLDEVSLLVHPLIVGVREHHVWHGDAGASSGPLVLIANETLEDDLVWLRYRPERARGVAAGGPAPSW